MRFSKLLVLALAATASLTNAQTQTCKLDSLTLSNGLTLSYPFNPDTLNYFCSCLYSTEYTTVTAHPRESTARLELSLNGNVINGFVADTASSNLPLEVGTNNILVGVNGNQCQNIYNILCERQPPSGGSIIGDPQFVGLLGQSYQVHGVSDEIYNLISSPALQYNAKFVFLSEGKCPVVDGVKQKQCFSHPGSYLGEVGFVFQPVSAPEVTLRLISGSATVGFSFVTLNGTTVVPVGGEVRIDDQTKIQYINTHRVIVSTPTFELTLDNSDYFVNQQIKVKNWNAIVQDNTHGLLGQTWAKKPAQNANKRLPIEGEVDDYVVADKDLFGTKFAFNKFKTAQA